MQYNKQETAEVVIPLGYEIEDILDMDDDFDEPPIMEEEVRLRFEQRGKS